MSTFHLQIVTPDGMFYDGEADKVLTRTIDGDVCILARHADYVTALGMGTCIVEFGGQRRKAACSGGMLSVIKGEVHVLASTFEWADEIDVRRAEIAKQEAEKRLAKKLDNRDMTMAEAKLKRAMTRINAAK
ncbi:MAG: ATP synthase F1 subunit epsilon [Butyricicoccaceae bacterium]